MTQKPEYILCAAIIYKGGVVIGGHRHADCIENLKKFLEFPGLSPGYLENLEEWLKDTPDAFQFITSWNKLYGRAEAYWIAKAAGQLRIIHDDTPILTSEDLY